MGLLDSSTRNIDNECNDLVAESNDDERTRLLHDKRSIRGEYV